MTIEQQILSKSEELFLRYGLKSVSMDDISRALGISKKTLYQYVDNKADLINQVVAKLIDAEKKVIDDIRKHNVNALEEMWAIAAFVTQTLRKISPTTTYDLKKYYRECWTTMEGLHRQHIYVVMKDNLERGIEQGIYRADLNPDIIAKMYVVKSAIIVNEEVFSLKKYAPTELFSQLIVYHLGGIVSEKGRVMMEAHLKKKAIDKNDG